MKINFCSMALVGAACAGAGLVVTAAAGQSGGDSAEAHIEAARRAAGSDYLPVFNGLCGSLTPQRAPQPAPAVTPAPVSSADPPPRAQWHVEPVKVSMSLPFGQSEYTAWAITTSAGIIVTDLLFEYQSKTRSAASRTSGWIPVRSLTSCEPRHDHVGAPGCSAATARVIMSAADWDLVLGNQQPYPAET